MSGMNSNRLGKVAGLLGRVQDLIVEDGEVESQAEPDWVCGLHVLLADLKCILVGLLRVFNRSYMKTNSNLTAISLIPNPLKARSVDLGHKNNWSTYCPWNPQMQPQTDIYNNRLSSSSRRPCSQPERHWEWDTFPGVPEENACQIINQSFTMSDK